MESVGEVPARKDDAILGRTRAYLQQVAAVVDGSSVAVARAELECGRRVAGEISVADVRSVYSELAGIVAHGRKPSCTFVGLTQARKRLLVVGWIPVVGRLRP